jgi:hypothetical protein
MRRATRADIGTIVSVLKVHHAEHDFPFPFDAAQASIDVATAIEDEQWLCLVDGQSLFLGHWHRPPFVPVLIASEVMLRCEKPGMRKLFVAEFELWATAQGCSIAALATTHSIPAFARLYRRDGYRLAEAQFVKGL